MARSGPRSEHTTQEIRFIGVICGIAFGLLTAMIHAVVSINIKADQIISGIAINLFAVGITKFVLEILFHSSSNSDRIVGLPHLKLPFIERSPEIARLLGNPLVLLTVFIVIASHFIIFKTRFGLRLRAVGENPEAADTVGISVSLYRYYGVMISGVLAGLGGRMAGVRPAFIHRRDVGRTRIHCACRHDCREMESAWCCGCMFTLWIC